MRRSRQKNTVISEKAPDVEKRVNFLIKWINIDWLKGKKIYCLRSYNSSSKAYARIWGLSKVWQIVTGLKPSYIIEVLSEKFDNLDLQKKDKILLHEIAHIPKNFSGSLLPHIKRIGKRNFDRRVNELYLKYLKK